MLIINLRRTKTLNRTRLAKAARELAWWWCTHACFRNPTCAFRFILRSEHDQTTFVVFKVVKSVSKGAISRPPLEYLSSSKFTSTLNFTLLQPPTTHTPQTEDVTQAPLQNFYDFKATKKLLKNSFKTTSRLFKDSFKTLEDYSKLICALQDQFKDNFYSA